MAPTIHSAFLPSKKAAEEVVSHTVKMRYTRKGRTTDGRLHRFIFNEHPVTKVSSGLGKQYGSDPPQGRLHTSWCLGKMCEEEVKQEELLRRGRRVV